MKDASWETGGNGSVDIAARLRADVTRLRFPTRRIFAL
jgi:hypothetical protein